jgi:hypothetical protein
MQTEALALSIINHPFCISKDSQAVGSKAEERGTQTELPSSALSAERPRGLHSGHVLGSGSTWEPLSILRVCVCVCVCVCAGCMGGKTPKYTGRGSLAGKSGRLVS